MKLDVKIYFIASEFYSSGYTFGAVDSDSVDIYEDVDYAVLLDTVEVDLHEIDTNGARQTVLKSMVKKRDDMIQKHKTEIERLNQRIEEFRAHC